MAHKTPESLLGRIEYRLAHNRLSMDAEIEWLLLDIKSTMLDMIAELKSHKDGVRKCKAPGCVADFCSFAENKKTGDPATLNEIKELIECFNEADLRIIYATIGGKLGKRKISPEQQAKMQQARKRKVI